MPLLLWPLGFELKVKSASDVKEYLVRFRVYRSGFIGDGIWGHL